ncbi:MAG: vanadium-dependent haloperoxidase [Ideonella sp.]
MPNATRTVLSTLVAACACLFQTACGGDNGGGDEPVFITVAGPNTVSIWDEVAAATINQPAGATGTAEEQRPIYATDLATVHVAMYDAVIAIAGTHRPFAVTPTASTDGASQDAAAGEAAYQVLRGLFPARTAVYQSAHDSLLASLPDGSAKTLGLAVGAEVAAKVLALRAGDGRSIVLTTYVPGTLPGQFRGLNPINRYLPSVKPFALTSNAQFRAPGPPALTSAAYASDVEETRALGAVSSSTRTAAQTEIARFHTEPPFALWPRNLRRFATTGSSLAEQARLMAMLWVTHSDATNACFESKYQFQFWRPLSAITLADSDGNAATAPDTTWAAVVPTPNHPEYPAAHGCVAGALAETLRQYYGTTKLNFEFDSTVTGSKHAFASIDAMVDEVQLARIAGGMHFRTSTLDGVALGRNVAQWALARNFQPR